MFRNESMNKRGLLTENKKQKNEARIQNSSSYYSERGRAGASGVCTDFVLVFWKLSQPLPCLIQCVSHSTCFVNAVLWHNALGLTMECTFRLGTIILPVAVSMAALFDYKRRIPNLSRFPLSVWDCWCIPYLPVGVVWCSRSEDWRSAGAF
jgi:hypothetical protein